MAPSHEALHPVAPTRQLTAINPFKQIVTVSHSPTRQWSEASSYIALQTLIGDTVDATLGIERGRILLPPTITPCPKVYDATAFVDSTDHGLQCRKGIHIWIGVTNFGTARSIDVEPSAVDWNVEASKPVVDHEAIYVAID